MMDMAVGQSKKNDGTKNGKEKTMTTESIEKTQLREKQKEGTEKRKKIK